MSNNQDMTGETRTPSSASDITGVVSGEPRAPGLPRPEKRIRNLQVDLDIMGFVLERHASVYIAPDVLEGGFRALLTTTEDELVKPPFFDESGEYHTGSMSAMSGADAVAKYEKDAKGAASILFAGAIRIDISEKEQIRKEDGIPFAEAEEDSARGRAEYMGLSSSSKKLEALRKLATEVDEGLLRNAGKFIGLWSKLTTEAGQIRQSVYQGDFDSLPREKKLKAVKRVLSELDELISARFTQETMTLQGLLREKGDTQQEIDDRLSTLKQGFNHASRSQKVQISHETRVLATEIMLEQFPLYLTVIRELSDSEAELDGADTLETEFYTLDKSGKTAAAISARQRAKIKLEDKFIERRTLLLKFFQEQGAEMVPGNTPRDNSLLILRAVRDEWRTSSLSDRLHMIKSQEEEEELKQE